LINKYEKLYIRIYSTVIGAMSQEEIDRIFCDDINDNMELFSINFFDIDFWSLYDLKKKLSDKLLLSRLIRQAKIIVIDEKENNNKRAEALVRTYQLLKIVFFLVPKLLEYALKLVPDMPLALVNMGIHYSNIKNNKCALRYFNKAIKVDPLYPYSWVEKADIEKNYKNRFFYYSEFLRLKSDSARGYCSRIILIEDKIYNKIPIKKIFNDFNIAKQLIEDNASLLDLNIFDLNLDNCLSVFHNWLYKLSDEKTINFLNIINNIFPFNTTAYWITQLIYANTMKYDNYIIAINKYSEIIDNNNTGNRLRMHCYFNRSKIYFRKKEFKKAFYDNSRLLEIYPQLPKINSGYEECNIIDIRKERINILKEMGEYDKVIQEYSLVLNELDKYKDEISEIYMERAWYYKINNETEKALADFSKVIEIGVDNINYTVKGAYAARIDILKERGEMEKAFEEYLKMSNIKKSNDYLSSDRLPDWESTSQYKIIE